MVGIQGDAFEKLRDDFDAILNDTIKDMKEKESTTARLTITLDISLLPTSAPIYAQDGSTTFRDVFLPSFSHKVASDMHIKKSVSGVYAEQCEARFDEDLGKYILIPFTGGQLTLTEEVERSEHVPYEYDEEDFDKCL